MQFGTSILAVSKQIISPPPTSNGTTQCSNRFHEKFCHCTSSINKNLSRSVSGSGFGIQIQEGKNDPQKYKHIKKFHVLKCWMFSFES
jgi:hypothetical protein